jgi:hypothetical protein
MLAAAMNSRERATAAQSITIRAAKQARAAVWAENTIGGRNEWHQLSRR